jgi:hypothetical protein
MYAITVNAIQNYGQITAITSLLKVYKNMGKENRKRQTSSTWASTVWAITLARRTFSDTATPFSVRIMITAVTATAAIGTVTRNGIKNVEIQGYAWISQSPVPGYSIGQFR